MTIGSGIAIAGIWIGVALSAWADFAVGYIALPCALIGTLVIAAPYLERKNADA
jgi:hypothetical protein